MIANGIICFMFGMGVGMAITMIVVCVGSSNHEEEAYKEGYDRGFSDGMKEARLIWTCREREGDK